MRIQTALTCDHQDVSSLLFVINFVEYKVRYIIICIPLTHVVNPDVFLDLVHVQHTSFDIRTSSPP